MNELAVMDSKAPLVAGSRVHGIIPRDIDQVWRIAQMIHKAGMMPKDFQTPEKIAVAILHGAEIGLPPMMALQRIAVINGRPSVWGEAVPGIALATGLVEDWMERIDGEAELMVATCRVKRRGIRTPAEKQFSVADAKRAGLWGKAGPWTQYPRRMLTMRARSAFRDLFADALGGLYIAEELIGTDEPRDIMPVSVVPIPQQPPWEEPAPPSASNAPRPLPPIIAGPKPAAKKRGRPPKVIQQLPQNPEEILKWIDDRLAKVNDLDEFSTVWVGECEPKLEDAFPPDREAADAIANRHRERLE